MTTQKIVPNEQSARGAGLPTSSVSSHGPRNPAFSGRTANEDASKQVEKPMIGEIPAPETLLASNYQYDGPYPSNNI